MRAMELAGDNDLGGRENELIAISPNRKPDKSPQTPVVAHSSLESDDGIATGATDGVAGMTEVAGIVVRTATGEEMNDVRCT